MESVADGTTTSHTVKGSVASANVVSFAEDRTLPTLESTSVQVGAKPDDKKHIRPLATHPLPPLPQGTAHTVSASDVSPCPVSIQSDINLASENTSVTQISAAHSTMLPVPPLNPCTQISAVHSAMLPAHPLNPCTQISAAHSTTLPALPPARVDPKYASFPQHKYHGQSCSEPSTNDSTQNELIPRCQRMASLIRWTSIYCSRANVQLPAHSRQQSGPSIPSASMIWYIASNSTICGGPSRTILPSSPAANARAPTICHPAGQNTQYHMLLQSQYGYGAFNATPCSATISLR